MTDTFVQTITSLGFLDYSILGLALLILFAITYFKGKDEKDTKDFFLGRRKTPMWVACLSFVATEISAMTIVGVPAVGFKENWQYLQFFIGSAAARLLIAYLFIPAFYKYNCTTIYEFLKHRFGSATQYSGSIFFFITRLLASGVRLYAASLAVSVIMGWDLKMTLLFFTVISMAFIGFGGIKAVVWTGAFEAITFYIAGIGIAVYLILNIQGGFLEFLQVAGEAGKLSVFNFAWDVKDPNVLLIAVINGMVGSMAAFGTDQEMMQRLLTVDTRESSQKTLVATIFASFPLVLLYLAIGSLIFVFYQQNPSLPVPDNSDKIISHFTFYILPAGLKGLILTAIILASIDSPLSSLSSSFVTDIYRPLLAKHRTEKHYLLISRVCVVTFALVLAGTAFLCQSVEGMLWLAFKINGVTAGSLLGVFLLGLMTKRHANRANIFAMVFSAVSMGVLLYLSETGKIGLGWSWLIVIGTISTFVLGYLLGPIMDKNRVEGKGVRGEN
ncbi:MAG: sodium/solute symporter [Elusimicrobiota bacterium]|nr:sodium/solute symporter [Elusimicrobiota bacterium]